MKVERRWDAAAVSCGTRRFILRPGETLTFGRGTDHPLRFGHAPADLAIPRFAGKLECREGGVLIHNPSSGSSIRLRTVGGSDVDIGPMTTRSTGPYRDVRLSVAGGFSTFCIDVALVRNRGDDAGHPGGRDPSSVGLTDLSDRSRIVLTALCGPLLSDVADGTHTLTYRSLARILNRHGYRCRKVTVVRLVDEICGWPLSAGPARRTTGVQTEGRLLSLLSKWALASGTVDDRDLAAFGGNW